MAHSCDGRRAGSERGWLRPPSGLSVPVAAPRSESCRALFAVAAGQGPIYGLVVWLGFELGVAPALGLSQSKRLRPVERLTLAADHLLYGLVLSEPRRAEQGQ